MTSTAAKLVWRVLAEEKGDWRTSRCVPCSMNNALVGMLVDPEVSWEHHTV